MGSTPPIPRPSTARPGEEITQLVFWREFNPRTDPALLDRETELVREAAALTGLDLTVVSSDVVRTLVGLVDLNDATSALVATIGLSLPGLAATLVIPSTLGYRDLMQTGTHPLLDPLWSTEAVQVVHDSVARDRVEKIEWLVEHRPDLLPYLQSCVETRGLTNCGRCGKCIWTMIALEAVGALGQATGFPSRVDPDVVRATERAGAHQLMGLDAVHRRLAPRPEFDELREAIRESLRRSAGIMRPHDFGMMASQKRWLWSLMHGELLDEPARGGGVASAGFGALDPGLPPPRDVPPGHLGLVRAIDHGAGRHRYALGAVPPGQRSGELGAALESEPARGVELRLDERGQPLVQVAQGGRPPVASVVRWVLSPFRQAGGQRPRRAATAVAKRFVQGTRAVTRPRASGPRVPASSAWLHGERGAARVPLLAAPHRVLDDVLLTTDPHEPSRLGYGPAVMLGYLEALAPVTGVLGPAGGEIPWAHNRGLPRTDSR